MKRYKPTVLNLSIKIQMFDTVLQSARKIDKKL